METASFVETLKLSFYIYHYKMTDNNTNFYDFLYINDETLLIKQIKETITNEYNQIVFHALLIHIKKFFNKYSDGGSIVLSQLDYIRINGVGAFYKEFIIGKLKRFDESYNNDAKKFNILQNIIIINDDSLDKEYIKLKKLNDYLTSPEFNNKILMVNQKIEKRIKLNDEDKNVLKQMTNLQSRINYISNIKIGDEKHNYSLKLIKEKVINNLVNETFSKKEIFNDNINKMLTAKTTKEVKDEIEKDFSIENITKDIDRFLPMDFMINVKLNETNESIFNNNTYLFPRMLKAIMELMDINNVQARNLLKIKDFRIQVGISKYNINDIVNKYNAMIEKYKNNSKPTKIFIDTYVKDCYYCPICNFNNKMLSVMKVHVESHEMIFREEKGQQIRNGLYPIKNMDNIVNYNNTYDVFNKTQETRILNVVDKKEEDNNDEYVGETVYNKIHETIITPLDSFSYKYNHINKKYNTSVDEYDNYIFLLRNVFMVIKEKNLMINTNGVFLSMENFSLKKSYVQLMYKDLFNVDQYITTSMDNIRFKFEKYVRYNLISEDDFMTHIVDYSNQILTEAKITSMDKISFDFETLYTYIYSLLTIYISYKNFINNGLKDSILQLFNTKHEFESISQMLEHKMVKSSTNLNKKEMILNVDKMFKNEGRNLYSYIPISEILMLFHNEKTIQYIVKETLSGLISNNDIVMNAVIDNQELNKIYTSISNVYNLKVKYTEYKNFNEDNSRSMYFLIYMISNLKLFANYSKEHSTENTMNFFRMNVTSTGILMENPDEYITNIDDQRLKQMKEKHDEKKITELEKRIKINYNPIAIILLMTMVTDDDYLQKIFFALTDIKYDTKYVSPDDLNKMWKWNLKDKSGLKINIYTRIINNNTDVFYELYEYIEDNDQFDNMIANISEVKLSDIQYVKNKMTLYIEHFKNITRLIGNKFDDISMNTMVLISSFSLIIELSMIFNTMDSDIIDLLLFYYINIGEIAVNDLPKNEGDRVKYQLNLKNKIKANITNVQNNIKQNEKLNKSRNNLSNKNYDKDLLLNVFIKKDFAENIRTILGNVNITKEEMIGPKEKLETIITSRIKNIEDHRNSLIERDEDSTDYRRKFNKQEVYDAVFEELN